MYQKEEIKKEIIIINRYNSPEYSENFLEHIIDEQNTKQI